MERETYDEYSSTLEDARLPVYSCCKNKAIFIATRRPLFFQACFTKRTLEKRETIMGILEKNGVVSSYLKGEKKRE